MFYHFIYLAKGVPNETKGTINLKLFLYIKKWHRPGEFVPLRALALVVNYLNLGAPKQAKFHCLAQTKRGDSNEYHNTGFYGEISKIIP